MDAYVKSFATYRTVKKFVVLSSALTLDSLDAETSTVTVVGTDIGRSHTGDWLLIDGLIYRIQNVKPQTDRTLLTLQSPLDCFSRPIELLDDTSDLSIGGFILDTLEKHWLNCGDPVYAMPYLVVSNLDTTHLISPELDSNGCFVLSDYCRMMRKAYRIAVKFVDMGSALACIISKARTASHQVSFDDGRSMIQSVSYSTSGTAKLTVLCDVNTGATDKDGNPIMERQRTTWYLSDTGTVSQDIPPRRAAGEWKTISVRNPEEIEEKVIETFSRNKANHKIEFWSTLDLTVHDDCTFNIYGEVLQSYISYKRKSSTDKRWYYRSGELATTASEKLRGVSK